MKRYNITVNGVTYDVAVEEVEAGASSAPAFVPAPVASAAPAPAPKAAAPASAGGVSVNSPMPGTILNVKVSVGQSVNVFLW